MPSQPPLLARTAGDELLRPVGHGPPGRRRFVRPEYLARLHQLLRFAKCGAYGVPRVTTPEPGGHPSEARWRAVVEAHGELCSPVWRRGTDLHLDRVGEPCERLRQLSVWRDLLKRTVHRDRVPALLRLAGGSAGRPAAGPTSATPCPTCGGRDGCDRGSGHDRCDPSHDLCLPPVLANTDKYPQNTRAKRQKPASFARMGAG
jgi:hypothetical protein